MDVVDEKPTLPGWMADIDGDVQLPASIAAILPASAGPVLTERTSAELQQDRLREIEDSLLTQSLSVIDDTLAFRDIAPEDTDPPPEWILQYGKKEAMKRFRLAKAGWATKKDAPSGAAAAERVAVGIIKARATEKAGPKSLNIAVVQIAIGTPQTFPEREIE